MKEKEGEKGRGKRKEALEKNHLSVMLILSELLPESNARI